MSILEMPAQMHPEMRLTNLLNPFKLTFKVSLTNSSLYSQLSLLPEALVHGSLCQCLTGSQNRYFQN